jgi:hypothetical protein
VDRILHTLRMNGNFKAYFPWRLAVAYGRDTQREQPLVGSETVPFAPKRDG